MKNKYVRVSTRRRFLSIPCAAALALSFTAGQPVSARDDHPRRPPVPGNIEAPVESKVFFAGHAVGTQNYICLPSGGGVAWTLFGPQATLFDDHEKQVITHFLSANPDEGGILRATWQHSRDTSAVWARATQTSSDPDFVAPGAIPWLLLEIEGTEDGPMGGEKLTAATHIQRVNTAGGMAPGTGCTLPSHVGNRVFVPYEADYFFYKVRRGN
jgi:hypothetical protein